MSDKETTDGACKPIPFPCYLETTEHDVHVAREIPTLLASTFGDSKIAGIVWATDGARAVSGINPTSAGPDATLEVSSPDSFDIERVYEARIWRVIDANRDDATIAHEFRWVNGVGAVELTLTEDTAEAVSESSESKPVSGWFHKVIYLQHQSAEGSDADSASEATSVQTGESKENTTTKQMTAVEFIQQEDKYGNTVVVDQLFTGEWAQ